MTTIPMAENGKLPASDLAPIAQGQLRKDCAAAWNAMNVESRKLGLELVPTGSKSSYRTYEQQVELYNAYLNGTGNLAAKPGTSNHGWGTAVDTPNQNYWDMITRIGAKYGYSKAWSDAPSEPWHFVYQAGHYSGPDPGPDGQSSTIPKPPEGTVALAVVVKANKAIEVFVEKDDGRVFHTWQSGENGKWYTTDGGKSIGWQPMGNPGGK